MWKALRGASTAATNSCSGLVTRTRKGYAQKSLCVYSSVLCTVAVSLTDPAVLQIKGTSNIRSMCGAAKWLLQQVWLGLCAAARLCRRCAAAAVSESSRVLLTLGCSVRPAASKTCGW